MTAAAIADAGDVYVVDPKSVPNPNWARPGIPGAGQQAYGDESASTPSVRRNPERGLAA